MRTRSRVLTASVALLAALPLGGMLHAGAEDSTEAAAAGAWFWAAQTSGSLPGAGAPAPGVPVGASGIEGEDLGVARTSPDKPSDKEAYLAWDLTSVPLDATITAFLVTLPLSIDSTSANQANADMVVCTPKTGWGPGFGDAYASKPEVDCSRGVPPVFDEAAQAYKIDITEFAKTWLTQDNFGIAIVPAANPSGQPFQVAFKKASEAKAAIAYEAAPVVPLPPVAIPPAPSGPIGPIDSGTVVTPPVDTPQPGSIAPVPVPQTPTVTRAVAPVAAGDTTPDGTFWVAALSLVFLLGLTSLVLGDPDPAVAADRSESRFAKALRERQAGIATEPARSATTSPRTV